MAPIGKALNGLGIRAFNSVYGHKPN